MTSSIYGGIKFDNSKTMPISIPCSKVLILGAVHFLQQTDSADGQTDELKAWYWCCPCSIERIISFYRHHHHRVVMVTKPKWVGYNGVRIHQPSSPLIFHSTIAPPPLHLTSDTCFNLVLDCETYTFTTKHSPCFPLYTYPTIPEYQAHLFDPSVRICVSNHGADEQHEYH